MYSTVRSWTNTGWNPKLILETANTVLCYLPSIFPKAFFKSPSSSHKEELLYCMITGQITKRSILESYEILVSWSPIDTAFWIEVIIPAEYKATIYRSFSKYLMTGIWEALLDSKPRRLPVIQPLVPGR